MVVTSHPLGSAAGLQMLAASRNAVDPAVAAMFTLSVVGPMMIGPLGDGFAHLRRSNGFHRVLEGSGRCPFEVGWETFEPDPQAAPGQLYTVGGS
jgi:gamma-glutamyltranspeptidase/glutathione hydrolase